MPINPWGQIVKRCFRGNQRIKAGRPKVIVRNATGAPTGTPAPVGTLCWNRVDNDGYICTVATGTWVKINS